MYVFYMLMFLSIVSQIEEDLLPTDGTIRGWKLRVAFLSRRTAPGWQSGDSYPDCRLLPCCPHRNLNWHI